MSDPVEAVRELRSSLGDTLQAFAGRLGLSISAITNYESGRRPTGKALYRLEQLSRATGHYELARVFADALATEMDWSHEPAQPVWVGVVRELVRNEKQCKGWPGIAALIVTELEQLIVQAKSGMRIESPLKDHDSAIANLESWLTEVRCTAEGSVKKLVDRLAREWVVEHPTETIEAGKATIWITNPDLYSKWQQERADAARGTQFESTLALEGTRQHAQKHQHPKGRKSTRSKK
ncbi:MAG: helix-turn-helix transcriptional regulator [Acidobacteria bacterium]|nr:helix-turn-helix transcriptional regulator [Acidobacteriota bacterium]